MSRNPANIKKIPVAQLRPGMYIHDGSWLDHSFVANSFAVRDDKLTQQVRGVGIRKFCVDTNVAMMWSKLPPP